MDTRTRRRAADRPAAYLPTPDEVRRMCDDIQSHWSDTERAKRWIAKPRHWTPQVVRAADLGIGLETPPANV